MGGDGLCLAESLLVSIVSTWAFCCFFGAIETKQLCDYTHQSADEPMKVEFFDELGMHLFAIGCFKVDRFARADPT
ncbi:hypothetical protein D3C75_1147520 [compost metagenome]